MAMPGQERPAAAEEVAGAGAQEQQPAEGEQVRVEHPGELAPRETEALLDVREGDVDDGRVQDDHELGGQNHEQEHEGVLSRLLRRPGRPGDGSPDRHGAGRDSELKKAFDSDLSAGILGQAEASSG